jgi:hypothetical protein
MAVETTLAMSIPWISAQLSQKPENSVVGSFEKTPLPKTQRRLRIPETGKSPQTGKLLQTGKFLLAPISR